MSEDFNTKHIVGCRCLIRKFLMSCLHRECCKYIIPIDKVETIYMHLSGRMELSLVGVSWKTANISFEQFCEDFYFLFHPLVFLTYTVLQYKNDNINKNSFLILTCEKTEYNEYCSLFVYK